MQSDAHIRLKEIQKILREDWDPIGCVPDDEYDSYGAEIYSMFLRGPVSYQELIKYLDWGETENMGLSSINEARNGMVANKILSLFKE